MRNGATAIALLSACALAAPTAAQPASTTVSVESTIVYIECTSPNGAQRSRGTGVLVSQDGHILTARHVAPDGYRCMGVIGTAAETPTRVLLRDSRRAGTVDAALLRFTKRPGEVFPFLRYRRIDDGLRGQAITAHGFPRSSTTGDVFTTEGVLAQTTIDGNGVVGTTGLTSSGMSGGPVLLKRDGSLIGIVAGATFDDTTGAPASFGVLAASEVAVLFELTPFSSRATGDNERPGTPRAEGGGTASSQGPGSPAIVSGGSATVTYGSEQTRQEDFSQRSRSINVGCDDSGSAQVQYNAPTGWRIVAANARWVESSDISQSSAHIVSNDGNTAIATGSIRGRNSVHVALGVRNCPSGGHATLEVHGRIQRER